MGLQRAFFVMGAKVCYALAQLFYGIEWGECI